MFSPISTRETNDNCIVDMQHWQLRYELAPLACLPIIPKAICLVRPSSDLDGQGKQSQALRVQHMTLETLVYLSISTYPRRRHDTHSLTLSTIAVMKGSAFEIPQCALGRRYPRDAFCVRLIRWAYVIIYARLVSLSG